jgi:hypothetical protein
VILRVLGASTAQLLALQLAEFGLLAAVLALVALGLGGGAAWLVVVSCSSSTGCPTGRACSRARRGDRPRATFALGASLPLLRARPARTLRASVGVRRRRRPEQGRAGRARTGWDPGAWQHRDHEERDRGDAADERDQLDQDEAEIPPT